MNFAVAFKPLTKDDIADVLGVSGRTIENWVSDGTLAVLKHDKRAIFTAAAKAQQIADWLHAQQGNACRSDVRGAA